MALDLSREARMKRQLARSGFVFAALILVLADGHAQVAVAPQVDHEPMLASPDARLAANKRFVYDFWREVFEAGHMELAEKYMADGYIQHNPNVATGRAAFVAFFSKNIPPQPIEPRVKAPLVAILAEGNLVVLVFVRELPDPKDSTQKYTTTWFDMFRLEGGKIRQRIEDSEILEDAVGDRSSPCHNPARPFIWRTAKRRALLPAPPLPPDSEV
jgi:predicted SnoaL-like aldol condensation-catalyzing enzyme